MRVVLEEIWLILLIAVVAWLISYFASLEAYFVWLLFGLYVCWHTFWLDIVDRWVKGGDTLPDTSPVGGWGVVLEELVPAIKRQKSEEGKLEQREQFFVNIIDNLPIGIVVLNDEYLITSFNPATVDLIGLNAERDLGHSIIKILRQPDLVRFLRSVNSESCERNTFEYTVSQDRHLVLFLELSKLKSHGYLMVIYDVTEARRIDTMRRDFVANVSHEIRTPLSVIRGQSELLVESVGNSSADAQVELAAKAIETQTDRLTGLSDDLIRLMELENATHADAEEFIDLRATLMTLVHQLRARYPDDAQFDIDGVEDVSIKMRQIDLVSIFENLFTNAAAYIDSPARIAISTMRLGNGDMRLEFSDNGEGIAQEHLARLTERFYRVDSSRSRQQGGTGLGLSIVKHAMQGIYGSISIQSELGTGTTVFLLFPAACINKNVRPQ